jgi:hypothetical protein
MNIEVKVVKSDRLPRLRAEVSIVLDGAIQINDFLIFEDFNHSKFIRVIFPSVIDPELNKFKRTIKIKNRKLYDSIEYLIKSEFINGDINILSLSQRKLVVCCYCGKRSLTDYKKLMHHDREYFSCSSECTTLFYR